MGKLQELYSNQLELAKQLEELFKDVGTVMVLQGRAGAGGELLGDVLVTEFGFRYLGRGVFAKDGLLSKVIVVVDANADGKSYVRNVDVFQETTVITREEHFSSRSRKRPNVLCMDKDELEKWQEEYDKELEDLLC